MASIEIILRDDEGTIINQRIRNRYALSLGGERLLEIEPAVETFKRESLPEIPHDLLAAAQQQQIELIKKEQVSCNGHTAVTLKTSHGQFRFFNQRFTGASGERRFSWLGYTDQCRGSFESERLRSRCCYYANRMSYHEVSKLVKDETGSDLLSSQRIQAIVVEEARRLSMAPASRARAILGQGTPCPAINQQVDLYDEQSEEILLFNDGIQVKKQNATWEKLSERLPQEDGKAPKERVNTDVMRVQRAHGGFTYMMEGLDSDGTDGIPVRAEELVKSEVIREYGERTTSLNLVAITDGARTIRLFFERVFGVVIMLILDWYHLEKKVWDLMSMIAWNTKEKERHCREILSCLGQGHVDDALGYLRRAVSPRNTRKYHELITYLTKHNAEIINYEKRRDAGKPVGSGRMEKGVDRVIGHRQKDNGMSWSVVGSKALGILNVHELNEQIEEPGLLLAA